MDDKLKLILEKIGLEEKFYSEFKELKLEKVVFYKKVDEVKIILKNNSNFSVELYKSLLNCFENYFDKKIILEIVVENINYNYIYDFYMLNTKSIK